MCGYSNREPSPETDYHNIPDLHPVQSSGTDTVAHYTPRRRVTGSSKSKKLRPYTMTLPPAHGRCLLSLENAHESGLQLAHIMARSVDHITVRVTIHQLGEAVSNTYSSFVYGIRPLIWNVAGEFRTGSSMWTPPRTCFFVSPIFEFLRECSTHKSPVSANYHLWFDADCWALLPSLDALDAIWKQHTSYAIRSPKTQPPPIAKVSIHTGRLRVSNH